MTHPEHYAGAERLLMLANRHSEGVTYSGSREAVRRLVPECPTLTPLTESDPRTGCNSRYRCPRPSLHIPSPGLACASYLTGEPDIQS